jgi:hypothetical protein
MPRRLKVFLNEFRAREISRAQRTEAGRTVFVESNALLYVLMLMIFFSGINSLLPNALSLSTDLLMSWALNGR